MHTLLIFVTTPNGHRTVQRNTHKNTGREDRSSYTRVSIKDLIITYLRYPLGWAY